MRTPFTRQLALFRIRMGRVMPTIIAVLGLLLGTLAIAMAINQQRQDKLEESLMKSGVVCIAARDIQAGERIRHEDSISCINVMYRRELIAPLLSDEQQVIPLDASPVFYTDREGTMVAVVDIAKGQTVSSSDFFVPPRIVPDQAVVVIGGFAPIDPYSSIVLLYPISSGEEEPVIPEYPEARWLRVEGKCIEIRAEGCVFAIAQAMLLGPRIMSFGDNVLAAISGNDTLEFLEVLALITSQNVWYTNIPSLPEDRQFVPVIPAPISSYQPPPTVLTPVPTEEQPGEEGPSPVSTETPGIPSSDTETPEGGIPAETPSP